MLATNITIKNIDYEKTLEGVFPLLREKLAEKESEHMTIRLFQKLEDASLPIALDIMNRLPKETKTELMVQILNSYSSLIRNKLNEKLADHHIGKHLNVGEVSIIEKDDVLYLWIGQVKANYSLLVRELMPGRLGLFGGLAGTLMGENLEEHALKLLWNEERKQSALALARNVVTQYGIVMDLEDIELMKDTNEASDSIEVENHLHLTDEMEAQILNALAGYLKDTLRENNAD